ncbi:hypothetical protein pb186bvf_010446 [Paramecium bursaria]
MNYYLQFKDKEQEELYTKYIHKLESQTFIRYLILFMFCSIIGSLMYIINTNYVYFGVSSFFFIKCYLSLMIVRKSFNKLNLAAFLLQIEIQTILPVITLVCNENLNKGEVMIISTASQILSASYYYLFNQCAYAQARKLHLNLQQSHIIASFDDTHPVWISLSVFMMCYNLQGAYFQEKDKRNQFMLHKNAERIEKAFIDQLKLPVFRCRFISETQQLKFVSSNQQAKRSVNIFNQDTFNKFINQAQHNVTNYSIKVVRTSTQSIKNKKQQNLAYLIRQLFKKKLSDMQSIFSKNNNNYEFTCMLKEGQDLYELQLLLLNDKHQYCLIILQRKQEEKVYELEKKIQKKQNILTRLIYETSKSTNNCLEMITLHPMNKYLSGMIHCLTNNQILITNISLIFRGLKDEPKSEFYLYDFLNNLVSIYQQELYRRQIDLRINYKYIKLNTQRLKVMYLLLNMLQNSIKYCNRVIQISFNVTIDRNIDKTICCITFDNDKGKFQKNNYFSTGFLACNILVHQLGPYRSIKQYSMQDEFRQEAYLFTDS